MEFVGWWRENDKRHGQQHSEQGQVRSAPVTTAARAAPAQAVAEAAGQHGRGVHGDIAAARLQVGCGGGGDWVWGTTGCLA